MRRSRSFRAVHVRVFTAVAVASVLLSVAARGQAQEREPAPLPEPPESVFAPASVPDGVRVPPPSAAATRFSFSAGPGSPGAALAPGSGGWWMAPAGIALALILCGAACVAARRPWPQKPTSHVQVAGRVRLSPRHSIYLVQAGGRTLMIGTGPQGAPTLLGELTGQAETLDEAQAQPLRTTATAPTPHGGGVPAWTSAMTGFNAHVGDEV